MMGYKVTGVVYAIKFYKDDKLHTIMQKESDAIEYCKRHSTKYYWEGHCILSKELQLTTVLKRQNR